MTPDQFSLALRIAGLVALYQAAGIAIFIALFGRLTALSLPALRRMGAVSAWLALPLVLAHGSADAARLADEFAALRDPAMLQMAWQSSNGLAHVVQAAGLLLIALQLSNPRGGIHWSTIGAILAACALLLTGHSSVHPLRWLLAPLLCIHLLVIAFWFGALGPLFSIAGRESPLIAGRIVGAFSLLAGWAVPCILVAGAAVAYLLAPDLSMLQRRYGELVLYKLGLFLLLMPLAAWNKWRVTPRLIGGEAAAAQSLRRLIAIEYVLIVAVLSVTAVLTMFHSPEG